MNEIHSRINDYLDNQSSIIKIAIDSEGLIMHANKFSEKLAGKPLKATPICDFFTDFNANLSMEKLLHEEMKNALLNVNVSHNLPETYYFTSFRLPEGMMIIGEQDNSELDELRQNMFMLNNELSNMTRDLNKKNIQLEQLNNLKNQFLGMAAHDLRNPISSIMMFSELILDSDDYEISPELRQILSVIKNSSEFMLHLLEELLDVVKIESGKLQLNYQLIQPEDLLRKNIGINSLLAAKKDIRLVLNIPQPLPLVNIDPPKIEQVLNNLISNAVKYSHSNTIVTVNAISFGQYILISVQDQGQGIPLKEIDKVFIPFSKINVKATAGEKSTGLGLSIVKRIVTGHLGRIWVESEVGKGSTFYFTLPLKT
jgi:signal transduction histidine kinase